MTVLKHFLAAAAVAAALPALAQAESIEVRDAFALSSTAMARSGAAFMVIENKGTADDRLVEARSDVAERVELHTHLMDAQGVARMVEVKDGFVIHAGGSHALERGADHVMFMGLHQPFEAGQSLNVTLVFQQAGEVEIEVPVVASRPEAQGTMSHDHGHGHGHGG